MNTRVVNVVLDLDLGATEPEQPAEGVAQRGVPEVSDMRRLVGVDRRVFDDGLETGGGPRGWRLGDDAVSRERRPVEKDVESPKEVD